MNLQQAQQAMLSQLLPLYEDREAATITDWIMEKITGWKKLDRIIHKTMPLTADGMELFQRYSRDLLAHRPIQYVLQEAWFAGMKLYVDESVLIPRPETEELVEWVAEEAGTFSESGRRIAEGARASSERESAVIPGICSMLDIGTGSGCIAISLKKKLPANLVYACDVSPDALRVARRNAIDQQTDIQFLQLNFLDSGAWDLIPRVQILVSNPPYIPLREKEGMATHVVQFEPHLALFVPDKDPLIFFKALAEFGQQRLSPGGQIFAEIHEDLGRNVAREFEQAGFHHIVVKKDMQGKDRMIKATR